MKRGEVAVVLPALDEEGSVGDVVRGFLAQGVRVIVVDNGSRDRTASRAAEAGAEVAEEPRRGYGRACLNGISYLAIAPDPPEIVVFADCDGSLDPRDLPRLLTPIQEGVGDLVVGRRVPVGPLALPAHQRAGNRSVVLLLHALYGLRLHDVSSFRALRFSLVPSLALSETTYGLPVEMLVRAALCGARVREVDVTCRPRQSGRSKVSGHAGATIRAFLRMVRVGVALRLSASEGG
ncbi:MAG: glycosyltransferase family 2 protein [Euryarchaeota archaeon]|nr:glycosyltransferase family 2 protein [Euryarchaeota archaeon]MDE1835648.1 glycosyltransferase family 2 protein [Euryarchaeota archaeon]MDE1878996.1 glycosyltransferase family 2 protein [Euryarchaeota archaeon]MDE2043730.1 glycosyltransferase family 2 protein [Thermoplasmata archaeon]